MLETENAMADEPAEVVDDSSSDAVEGLTFDSLISGENPLPEVEETEQISAEEHEDNEQQEDGQQTEEEAEGEEEEGDGGEEEEYQDEEEDEEGGDDGDAEEGPRQIAIKDGEKFVNLDEEATIRMRVDGENQLVPLSELTERYQSQVEQDRQYEEFYEEKNKYEAQVQDLTQEMGLVGSLMKGDRPLDAVLYLAKVSGQEVVDLRQKIIDNLANDITPMVEMSEAERKLHLIEGGKVAEQRINALIAQRQQQAQQQGPSSNLDSLLRVSGVSRREFEQSRSFLGKDASPEEVIEYAQHAPYVEKASTMLAPLEDQLGQDDMNEFVGSLTMALRQSGGKGGFKMLQRVASQLGHDLQMEKSPKNSVAQKSKGGRSKPKVTDNEEIIDTF